MCTRIPIQPMARVYNVLLPLVMCKNKQGSKVLLKDITEASLTMAYVHVLYVISQALWEGLGMQKTHPDYRCPCYIQTMHLFSMYY